MFDGQELRKLLRECGRPEELAVVFWGNIAVPYLAFWTGLAVRTPTRYCHGSLGPKSPLPAENPQVGGFPCASTSSSPGFRPHLLALIKGGFTASDPHASGGSWSLPVVVC